MFEQECKLYAFNLGYLKRILDTVDDERLQDPLGADSNPPLWILGHLACATDYAAGQLGLPRACPKAWHQAFKPGSSSKVDLDPRPSKVELLAAIEAGHARVAAAAVDADPEAMAKPHGLAILEGTPLKTIGDLVAHLMSTHEAGHIGQLALWRRAKGAAHLF